jgi:subtilase family serine protease
MMKPTAPAREGRAIGARSWALVTIAACLAAFAATAAAAPANTAAGGAPALISHADDLGPVNRSDTMEVTVWLRLHDEAGLDRAISGQPGRSATWLSNEQIEARHAPAAADVTAVSAFLRSHGLTVTGVGPQNLFVKATGTAARVQAAFQVELHQYSFRGTTFRASASSPKLPPEIAPLVASVGGLSDLGARPNVARAQMNPNVARQTDGEGLSPRPLPLGAKANGLVFSPQCFYAPTSVAFSGNGVTASYQGNRFGADITNGTPGTVAPCGYQPSEIQTAYNLNPLYQAGLDGTGVTIAITDAFGSTTVATDLAAFSTFMGLPPPDLTIIGTATESNFSTDAHAGWAVETTLDVEWVHAIAPGAKILLVIAPTNSFDDLDAAIVTASIQPGVVSISNSWSAPESFTDIPLRKAQDQVLKLANARGQSVNFASGDNGNETIALGYADVDYPASSPYATAVGGVSVALDANQNIAFQTSWGNNITELADKISMGSPPIDPPFNEGFLFGGGGGTSNVYPLPQFQRSLGGERRLVPDISWLADPYTGAEIIFTADSAGHLGIEVIGGTSLATPMFSALWGIATQHALHRLGPAAPRLYRLPPGAITDVLGTPTSPNNVTGTLTDSNGEQHLTSWELALPLQGQQSFFSALYNSPFSTRWFVLTFGNDSTLKAGPGWDPATGLGTPNGWNFVQAFPRDD